MTEDKPKVLLDGWSFDGARLHGIAYGHPYFPNESYLHTSVVIGDVTEFKQGDVVETLNSLYTLGRRFDPEV